MRKKIWIIVGILIVVIGITAISIWLIQSNKQRMNQVAGVSIKIKEGTLTNTGGTFIITDTTDKNYSYGEPFRIDKKENGKWKEAPKVIEDAFFNMPAYYPDENNEIVREIDFFEVDFFFNIIWSNKVNIDTRVSLIINSNAERITTLNDY